MRPAVRASASPRLAGAAQVRNILHARSSGYAVVMGIRSRRRDMAGRRSGAGARRPSRRPRRRSRAAAGARLRRRGAHRSARAKVILRSTTGRPVEELAGGRARVQEFAHCRAASSGHAVGESQQISLICGLNLGWCGRARPGRRSVGCPADSLRCPCRKVREPPPLFQVEVRRAH